MNWVQILGRCTGAALAVTVWRLYPEATRARVAFAARWCWSWPADLGCRPAWFAREWCDAVRPLPADPAWIAQVTTRHPARPPQGCPGLPADGAGMLSREDEAAFAQIVENARKTATAPVYPRAGKPGRQGSRKFFLFSFRFARRRPSTADYAGGTGTIWELGDPRPGDGRGPPCGG